MTDEGQTMEREMSAPGLFRTRCEAGERFADQTIVVQVIKAIDAAVSAWKSERAGLGRRVSDAPSDAATLAGNGTDE
jgi:hypothetical protein